MATRIRDLGHDKSLRPVKIDPAGKEAFDRFLGELRRRLDDDREDDNVVVREVLADLYLEHGYPALDRDDLSPARAAAAASYDPRNVTLEPEYYSDIDPDRFYPRKPLIWLWIMFDRSPLGHNVYLGTQLRAMLAGRIFEHVGANVRIFRNVEFTYGYNLWVGDDVILHRDCFLDDRGKITLHDRSSVSDFAHIYSHSHHIEDQDDVSLDHTEIGPHARITYHATVLSGVRVGKDAMVGAHAMATRDVPEFTVVGGIPARKIREKAGVCPVCDGERTPYVPREGVER